MKYLLLMLVISCGRIDYEEVCKEKDGYFEDDVCYCNGSSFNPYSDKTCEEF
jgi:hypothetical protein